MTTMDEKPVDRETLRKLILSGDIGLPIASDAARWPPVARDALVAVWAVTEAAGLPPSVVSTLASAAPPEWSEWLDRLWQAPPLALVMLAHMELLGSLVPLTREDPDAFAAWRAGWEALHGHAPIAPLASLDAWPVETRTEAGTVFSYALPERLPPVQEARAWLDKLHAVVRRNGKEIQNAYASRRGMSAAAAARRAWAIAAELASEKAVSYTHLTLPTNREV